MSEAIEFFAPPIADSIAWAARLHRDQRDKAGKDYILHPLRVMQRFGDLRRQTAAVLHDVMEDQGVTDVMLVENGYCSLTIADLHSLSRRPGETYVGFIDRFILEASLEACEVKLKDLEDNMDPARAQPSTPDNDERQERYRVAHGRLTVHVGTLRARA